jgi:ubiquinone/menaquinone biosynthesis C-methylase UbiE
MPGEPTEMLGELLDVRDRDVLDVGCGEGGLVRWLATNGARAVGLDPLAVALERARSHGQDGPPVRYVHGGAEALPFDAASFDIVVFFNSLHHVPEDSMDAALTEAARVLRQGALAYVQEPLPEGPLFELMRSVEDETRVRGAAQQALGRALEGTFVELAQRDGVIVTRLDDFDAFRNLMVSVDPTRAAALDEQGSSLRERFERLGRPCPDGYEFDQPFRANLLRC